MVTQAQKEKASPTKVKAKVVKTQEKGTFRQHQMTVAGYVANEITGATHVG
jgi:hypothetical protein